MYNFYIERKNWNFSLKLEKFHLIFVGYVLCKMLIKTENFGKYRTCNFPILWKKLEYCFLKKFFLCLEFELNPNSVKNLNLRNNKILKKSTIAIFVRMFFIHFIFYFLNPKKTLFRSDESYLYYFYSILFIYSSLLYPKKSKK